MRECLGRVFNSLCLKPQEPGGGWWACWESNNCMTFLGWEELFGLWSERWNSRPQSESAENFQRLMEWSRIPPRSACPWCRLHLPPPLASQSCGIDRQELFSAEVRLSIDSTPLLPPSIRQFPCRLCILVPPLESRFCDFFPIFFSFNSDIPRKALWLAQIGPVGYLWEGKLWSMDRVTRYWH